MWQVRFDDQNRQMATDPQDVDTPTSTAYPRGAALVRRLFDYLEVPSRSRITRIRELMGWSYHPAYRRMRGEIPWAVEELENLAAQCGMSLWALLALETEEGSQPASFALGPLRIPCRVKIEGPTTGARPTTVVAVKDDGKWLVLSAEEAGDKPSFAISSVVLIPDTDGPRARVAVLDDSLDVTEPLCATLRTKGFDAQPYASFEQLSAALKAQPFDAYIIDWLVGSATAASLIAEIRASDPRCPIAVLTGKVREGQVDQDEVAAIVAEHEASFFEKPAPIPIIVAKFKHALTVQKTAPLERSRGGE